MKIPTGHGLENRAQVLGRIVNNTRGTSIEREMVVRLLQLLGRHLLLLYLLICHTLLLKKGLAVELVLM